MLTGNERRRGQRQPTRQSAIGLTDVVSSRSGRIGTPRDSHQERRPVHFAQIQGGGQRAHCVRIGAPPIAALQGADSVDAQPGLLGQLLPGQDRRLTVPPERIPERLASSAHRRMVAHETRCADQEQTPTPLL
jgi:hypothetical protein